MIKSKSISIAVMLVGLMILGSGMLSEVQAQRDPFRKATWATPKTQKPTSGTPGRSTAGAPKAPVSFGPPSIEARIEHYKRQREAAVAAGQPIPKVTSVLTLNEMTLSGIFKTPRGYAAMVEATPIKLSYTIYPGEKFFDGQLVAVEDNRLVFRKVTKTGEGKFLSSVEYMPLKQYSVRSQVEGTAPAGSQTSTTQSASSGGSADANKPAANPFLSPLDEMNSQSEGGDAKKPAKRPVRVAKRP
jgi:Tfp pilus assembly protein PilP